MARLVNLEKNNLKGASIPAIQNYFIKATFIQREFNKGLTKITNEWFTKALTSSKQDGSDLQGTPSETKHSHLIS